MNLPLDIPALLKAATDIDEARNTPLAVSVYIDETAPGDVVGHVRSAFASAGAKTRVTIGYLDDNLLAEPYGADDMAVIVAGDSPRIGEQAAHIRGAGIPVMVATTAPRAVAAAAEAAGWPVPEGDIVAPNMTNPTPFGDAARALARRITAGSTANEAPNAAAVEAASAAEAAIEDIEHALPVETEPADAEPIPLDGEGASTLDRRMGEWIIAACKDKRLAFALAFPFVRRPLSLDAVRATSVQNAGVGVVVFIPGADMPIMTLNQAKMLLQIAAAYGQPLSAERIKELAAVVGGAFLFRNIARTAVGVVPVLGWAIKGAVGFAGTEAMGHAAIEYFEAGGDIVGVASVVQKARDEAVEAASKAAATPAGGKVIEAARAPTTRSPTRRSSTSSWWGRAKSSCPRCWRSSASCAHPARPGPRFCARWRDAWGAPTCRACTAGAARTRPRLPAAGRSPCSTTCRVWCTSASSRVSPTARRSSP